MNSIELTVVDVRASGWQRPIGCARTLTALCGAARAGARGQRRVGGGAPVLPERAGHPPYAPGHHRAAG